MYVKYKFYYVTMLIYICTYFIFFIDNMHHLFIGCAMKYWFYYVNSKNSFLIMSMRYCNFVIFIYLYCFLIVPKSDFVILCSCMRICKDHQALTLHLQSLTCYTNIFLPPYSTINHSNLYLKNYHSLYQIVG